MAAARRKPHQTTVTERGRIAARMRRAVKDAEVEQQELAGRLGVSPSALSFWLTGRSQPSLEQFKQFCVLLGLSPAELLGLAESYEEPADALEDSARAQESLAYMMAQVDLIQRQMRQFVDRMQKKTSGSGS